MNDGTEAFEQAAASANGRAHEFWQCHYEMTVGNWKENVVDQIGGGGQHLALMAGRAKPAAFEREGQQVFLGAVVAADSGEAPFEGSAIEELAKTSVTTGRTGPRSGS